MLKEQSFISVDKDISPRVISEGKVRDMLNLIPLSNGASNSAERQNMLGTVAATITGMTDDNYSCKGIIVDEESSLMYLFCTSDITISEVVYEVANVIEYNPETNTGAEILRALGSSLINQSADLIEGFVESGFIYYNDGKLKRFSIQKAKDGDYDGLTGLSDAYFQLCIESPQTPPTAAKTTDAGVIINTIDKDSWQFRYRYVYSDGAKSNLSPYSEIITASLNPFAEDNPNKITVSFSTSELLEAFVTRVEVYYIKNNDGTHRLIETVDLNGTYSYNVVFDSPTGGAVLEQASSLKPFENISLAPTSIAYVENRIVAVKGQDQYDLTGDYEFTAAITTETAVAGKSYFKEDGEYDLGVVFLDSKGRRSPVLNKKTVKIPRTAIGGSSGDILQLSTSRPKITVSFSGTAPSWADKVVVVATKEQKYDEYVQVPVNLLFYIAPKASAEDFGESNTNFLFLDGNFYTHERAEMTSRLDPGENTYNSGTDTFHGWVAIDLQFPINMPVLPEVGWVAHFIDRTTGNGLLNGKNLRITEVGTNHVRVEGHGIEDFSAYNGFYLVEFYKPNEAKNNVFYDISTPSSVANYDSKTEVVYGDTYFIDLNNDEYKFNFNQLENYTKFNNGSWPYVQELLAETAARIESPTPVFSEQSLVDIANERLIDGGGFNVAEGKRTLTLDYSKKAYRRGEANIENIEYAPKNFGTVLISSNSFVENTKINGLVRFDFEDEFSVPNERTPITKLELVNDVLLALHERNATSVYIGEKFLRQASGEDVVTTTDGFFGDERLLQGGYGTINPESVKKWMGQCFWWDANRGTVVRYSSNGLEPISDMGLRDYFRTKGETYNKATAKVYGGIDPFLGLYIITFPTQDGLSAETWAWDISESEWLGRFSFIGEMYSNLGNVFVSFKSENMHEHNVNATRNNFYGSQYDSRVTFISNDNAAFDKSLDTISLDADSAWDVLSATTREGQDTDLVASEFVLKDSHYYADFLRDKNTNADLLGGLPALLNGLPVQSKYFEITLRKTGSTEQKINAAYIGYSILNGHLLQAQ